MEFFLGMSNDPWRTLDTQGCGEVTLLVDTDVRPVIADAGDESLSRSLKLLGSKLGAGLAEELPADGGCSPNFVALGIDSCWKPGVTGDLSWPALGDGVSAEETMVVGLRSRFKLPFCKERGEGM
jgi:hypothetical protein